jgi:preprotein translocase subunit SecE
MLQVRVLPGLFFKKDAEMKRIIQFFKDSFAELKKVTWPSREEVLASTKVVIIMILLIALVLGIFDILLYQGLYLLFRTL